MQGFSDHRLLAQPRAAHRLTIDAEETREGTRVRKAYARFGGLRVIELGANETPASALARLKATGRYEFVEPDLVVHADVTPNDPRFSTDQWPLSNSGASGGVAGADIKASTAWDALHDASSVIVAVIDSGVRLTHEDIAANLWTNPNPGTSGFGNDVHGINSITTTGDPTDDLGHGTHVSGIVGAVGNNGRGISGVAWNVRIMALRFISSSNNGLVSDEIECIDYAIAHGAQIINASFGDTSGGTTYSQSELSAITRARDAGIIFVAAAGNDTSNMDLSRHYPASFPLDNIVTVGSSTRRDEVSTFSNYGSGAVDLFAPGEEILSLDYSSNTGYVVMSGTSMAAPHVVGALALLKAKFPGDNYRQLINRLLRSVDTGAAFTGKAQTNGRLNLAKALASTDNRPFNDDFATRAKLSGQNITARNSSRGATSEPGEPQHAGAAGGASLWWEWTAPASGSVTVDTSGSAYDTLLAVYTGTALNALTPVASNDDFNGTTSRLAFTAQAGATYEIAVDGKNGATGLTLLNLGTVAANDSFSAAVTLEGVSTSVTATNAHSSREVGEPRILGNAGGLSLWYRWTAPSTGKFQISAVSDDFDPLLGIYTGSSVGNLSLVTSADNSGPNNADTGALCTLNATAGTSYMIAIDTKDASAPGTFTLSIVDSVWQAVTTDAVTGSPAVALDGTVYVGSTDHSLYAFNSDGTLKWSKATGGLIDTASPVVDSSGAVYVGSNDGKVYAFNSDGSAKWTFTVPASTTAQFTAVSNSPALAADGTLYIKSDDNNLYALNSSDGTQKWRFNTGGISYSSPTIAPDGTIYVGSDNFSFYAINPDGTKKWQYDSDNEIYSTPPIDAAGNVYFATLGGHVYSLTPAGSVRWNVTLGGAITSSPALSADGGTLYLAAYDHKFYALNSGSGATRWTYTLGNEVRASSPAVDANGVIYIGCYDNQLYALNADGTLKRTYAMGNWIRSSPAISGTRLYVGSNDHKVYAFDIGAAAAASPWPMYRHNARRLGRAVVVTPLSIQTQPLGRTVGTGYGFTLRVEANGQAPFTYQWYKNGAAISGATTSLYSVSEAAAPDAGDYTVVVRDSSGTAVTSGTATIKVEAPVAGRLINLSVLTNAGSGAQTFIVGFVVRGSPAKQMLVRAVGPGLVPFGLSSASVLADPTLEFRRTDPNPALLDTNDNWPAGVASVASSVGAFALTSGSKDAALVTTALDAGNYSATITGAGGGLALAEVYDTTRDSGARLVNVSARAQVSSTGNLTAGFVISGNIPKKVLVRGIGPTLANFGFATADVLAHPKLQIYATDGGTSRLVYSATAWGGYSTLASTFAAVGAFSLDAASQDAALSVSLDPGNYSAQVTSADGTPGAALVEVYEVP